MSQQPASHPNPPVLAAFDPTHTNPAHLRCYEAYLGHARALRTATVGNGLPTMNAVMNFIHNPAPSTPFPTSPHNGGEAVWVDPSYFVATPDYLDGWPAQRWGGPHGWWQRWICGAGPLEHTTHALWNASTVPLVDIEMSIQGTYFYMKPGAGGRHRWAAWKLLGYPVAPVLLG